MKMYAVIQYPYNIFIIHSGEYIFAVEKFHSQKVILFEYIFALLLVVVEIQCKQIIQK